MDSRDRLNVCASAYTPVSPASPRPRVDEKAMKRDHALIIWKCLVTSSRFDWGDRHSDSSVGCIAGEASHPTVLPTAER